MEDLIFSSDARYVHTLKLVAVGTGTVVVQTVYGSGGMVTLAYGPAAAELAKVFETFGNGNSEPIQNLSDPADPILGGGCAV